MRKILLSVLGLAVSAASFGQVSLNHPSYTPVSLIEKLQSGDLITAITTNQSPGPVKRLGTAPSTQVINVALIGNSANGFTVAFGARTALFAHPEINSVSQVYRAVTPSSGALKFGYSSDGGANWNINLGPIFSPGNAARYPQGLIYNPAGNTDPANAKIVYYSPTLDGASSCGSWGGHEYGVADFTTGANPTAGAYSGAEILIPDGGCINTGDNSVWISDIAVMADPVATCVYNGNLRLPHGTWNGTDFTYVQNDLPAPDERADGPIATKIAFGPDGLTGYAAFISHESFTDRADSTLYPTVYKTIDGGINWTKTASINLDAIDTTLQSGLAITTGFEFDMTVDANGNLHMVMDVGPAGSTAFSIIPQPGFFGVADIYTTDGGTTWNSAMLGLPLSFRGEFPDASGGGSDLSEDNRPQVCRTLDGSKLFFVWFDTDTLTFATTANEFPDAHVVGYDVATGLYTTDLNVTTGTAADGSVTFGNVAEFALAGATGNCYKVPVSFMLLVQGSTTLPVEHYYIDGIEICDADFTETITPDPLVNYAVGVNEIPDAATFAIGQNYPNPFSGTTAIDINVRTATTAVVEINNTLGQKVASSVHQLNAGVNTVYVDASQLTTGVYSYSVTVGNEKVSRMMLVK